MNIVNVGYDSTNYYVLGPDRARLLLDIGWPGTLAKLLATLKRKNIALESIRYALATHYHPDHAGLAQDLKARGVRLIVLEQQLAAIPLLKTYVKPQTPFLDITLHNSIRLAERDSASFLRGLGIAGTIVGTPGHSDDSVTLVLESGEAFTGDLPPPNVGWEAGDAVMQSWNAIRGLGARMIYPGHGPARPLPRW